MSCWPIANDKKRENEFRIVVLKKLEILHRDGLMPDKLTKRTIIASTTVGDRYENVLVKECIVGNSSKLQVNQKNHYSIHNCWRSVRKCASERMHSW